MSEPSSSKVDERFQRAHTLRDQALDLLHVAGDWQEIEGYPGKLRAYSDERLFVLHRTPFQPPPISEAAVAAGISAQAQRQAAREYGLDIWLDNKKVLCLIWNEGADLGVVLLRDGVWQEALAKVATSSRRR